MENERVVLVKAKGGRALQILREPLALPGPGEARVKILAAGVAFSDLMRLRGLYPGDPRLPYAPGWDLAGEIDALGAGVTNWQIGQRVVGLTGHGNFARYRTVRADVLIPAPEEVDPAQAVCLCLNYVTAHQMLHRVAQAQRGESVLLHSAAGGVGTAVLQMAALSGLKVYGVTSRRHMDTVTALGAVAIDRHAEDFLPRMRGLPGGGVDIALDPIGGTTVSRSFKALRPGGRLVSFGLGGLIDLPVAAVALAYVAHLARLKLWNASPGRRRASFYSIEAVRTRHPDWIRQDLVRLLELLRTRQIAPLIDAKLPLNQASQALERIAQGQVQGKLVLMCQE